MKSKRVDPAGPVRATDVAEYLDTSVSNLARWRFEGKGPKYLKLGGRSIRYFWSDVDAWLEQSREVPGA